MKMILVLMCALSCMLNAAEEPKSELRILELLPNLLCPLAVEPGVPADFVALSPRGTLDLYDWVYWGPKDVLQAYFKDPDSLKVPLLRVKLSANVAQTGPKSFGDDRFLEDLKQQGGNFKEMAWGDYPVLAVKTHVEDQLVRMAWVGLNDPESGWTLMFNLVYPLKKGRPNKKDIKLWEDLLKNTVPLKDGDYFKARGQDLQEGYTLVNVGGAKLKVEAEKRQSDGMIQVVVTPESPNVEFHYCDMDACRMGAKWKYGEPMVKVYGEIVIKQGNGESLIRHVTSIFYKTVEEFSVKADGGKNPLVFQKMGS